MMGRCPFPTVCFFPYSNSCNSSNIDSVVLRGVDGWLQAVLGSSVSILAVDKCFPITFRLVA